MRRFLPLTALLALAAAAANVQPVPAGDLRCTTDYSYAGMRSVQRAHGVRADISLLSAPNVRRGHVAAWIGVGGLDAGPGGTPLWIQVGLSGFEGSSAGSLYYEVAAPGTPPTYRLLEADVQPHRRFRLAVLEMAYRPGWWRVWVDGVPRSEPVHLPGSHGRWQGVATAESWNAGTGACNEIRSSFDGLSIARAPGGSWRRFQKSYSFRDPGFAMLRQKRAGFVATAPRA